MPRTLPRGIVSEKRRANLMCISRLMFCCCSRTALRPSAIETRHSCKIMPMNRWIAVDISDCRPSARPALKKVCENVMRTADFLQRPSPYLPVDCGCSWQRRRWKRKTSNRVCPEKYQQSCASVHGDRGDVGDCPWTCSPVSLNWLRPDHAARSWARSSHCPSPFYPSTFALPCAHLTRATLPGRQSNHFVAHSRRTWLTVNVR